MRNLFLDILKLRKPRINYTSPAICGGTISSGSGGPSTLTLDPIPVPPGVTGFFLTWDEGGGGGFTLNWDIYPGAICYTVFRLNDANDPFGAYHIIAECVPDNKFYPPTGDPGFVPGQKVCYLVQAITANGTTALSAPICTCMEITDSGVSPVIATVTAVATLGPVEFDPEDEATKFEWYKDGVFFADTTGTTQNELVFPSVQFADAGSYVLKITGATPACGVVESEAIVLQVIPVGPALLTLTWGTPNILVEPPNTIEGEFGVDSWSWEAAKFAGFGDCSMNNTATAPINILGGNRYRVEISYNNSAGALPTMTFALFTELGVITLENEINMDAGAWQGVGTASFEFVIPMSATLLTLIQGHALNSFANDTSDIDLQIVLVP